MSDTLDILKILALQVRNASSAGENTAERIGRTLIGIIENLSQSNIESLKELFLSKKDADQAAEIIDFLKGLTVNGDKASIDKDGNATVQQLIALVKAKVTDLEVTNAATAKTVTVSDKVTTLNLLVQKLAEMYDLKVSNVATLFRTIIKDYVSSETFIAGLAGEGFKLYKALSGDWNLELDNLTIRKAMTVFELIISKIRAVNGGLVVSQANGRVKSVNEDTTNYILGIEGDMTFVADDLVRCQVFGSSGAKYYWVRVSSVSNDSIIIAKSEFPEGTVPAVGDDLVQMGNKTNPARQGILYLTASEDGKPRFSVLDGVNSTDLTGKNKLILGCLDGITDSDFPSDAQPSGYGLWAVNVFLKGLFILRNGKSIEDELNDQITAVRTAFEIREGQISSKVTEATVAATNAGNSATLAQGYASTAGQKASAAAGSAADAKSAADNASDILSQVTTKESSINQTAGNITLQVQEVTTKVTTATNAANTATSKASEASTSAGTASTKASAAATSATNASNSASSAASSASAATNVLTTVTQKETSINQTAQAIELKAVRAESAAGRAESAEASINLKADGIVLQASNQAAKTAVDGVQVGGRNLILDSKGHFTKNGYANIAWLNLSKPLVAGQTYIFSIKFSSDTVIVPSYSVTDGVNNWNNRQSFNPNIPFQASNSSSASILVFAELGSGYTDAYELKLEEGNKATDWTPAPEDVSQDASDKANTVKTYTEQNFASLTVMNDAISGLASKTVTNGLESRLTSAEAKITPDQINLTVQSQINNTVITYANLAAKLAGAKMLYTDPAFKTGWNGIGVYNNYGNGTVSIDRVDRHSDNPTDSNYQIKIVASGFNQSPNRGGFSFANYAQPYAEYICKFIAWIPTNSAVRFASNSMGNGGYQTWLTPTQGQGKWTEYVSYVRAGDGGNSSTNFYYIDNWEDETLTWWLCYATVFDCSKNEYTPDIYALQSSFNMDASGISMVGKKIAFTGLMTFSSLAADAQNKINTAQSTADTANSTAGSALASAGTANSGLTTLRNSLGSLAYDNAVSFAKLDTTIIEGGYIKTSLINANAIITNELLATKIAATDITTGRLTVTDGAKIGGWIVEGNALKINSAAGAKILVEPSGTRFLRINDSSDALMAVRADGVTGISIYTQDTTGICLTMTAQTGGKAIESYGSCKFKARMGELISLLGATSLGGIAINATSYSSTSVTLTNEDSFVMCKASGSMSVYMPASPTDGKVIIICRDAHISVRIYGNGKYVRRGISNYDYRDIDNDGQMVILIYNGGYWYINYLNS